MTVSESRFLVSKSLWLSSSQGREESKRKSLDVTLSSDHSFEWPKHKSQREGRKLLRIIPEWIPDRVRLPTLSNRSFRLFSDGNTSNLRPQCSVCWIIYSFNIPYNPLFTAIFLPCSISLLPFMRTPPLP